MIPFAHIGFPKSGSTWLQRNIFKDNPEFHILGRIPGQEMADTGSAIFLGSSLLDRHEFLYSPKQTSELFEEHMSLAKSHGGKRAIGITCEIATNLFIGRLGLTERASRIRDLLGPQGRIVMVCREQVSWIESAYGMFVKEMGGTCSYEEFAYFMYYERDRSPLCSLFYDQVYDVYAELFSKENVLVVPYELLKRDPLDFGNKIMRFLGASPLTKVHTARANSRPSGRHLAACLHLNKKKPFGYGTETTIVRPFGAHMHHALEQEFSPPHPLPGDIDLTRYRLNARLSPAEISKDPELTNLAPIYAETPVDYVARLRSLFREHNARFERQTQIDLSRLGYATPNND